MRLKSMSKIRKNIRQKRISLAKKSLKIASPEGLYLSDNVNIFFNLLSGDPSTTRTCDPLLRRQMLYPAELPDH